MIKKNVTIELNSNLGTVPAMLVQLASRFESSIHIEKGNISVNAKSIMGMMTLGLNTNDIVNIEATGKDEDEALEALISYLGTK